MQRVNVGGTANVLEARRPRAWRGSWSGQCGAVRPHRRRGVPIRETTPMQPLSPYAGARSQPSRSHSRASRGSRRDLRAARSTTPGRAVAQLPRARARVAYRGGRARRPRRDRRRQPRSRARRTPTSATSCAPIVCSCELGVPGEVYNVCSGTGSPSPTSPRPPGAGGARSGSRSTRTSCARSTCRARRRRAPSARRHRLGAARSRSTRTLGDVLDDARARGCERSGTCRSSQPSSVAIARGSWRRRWPAPCTRRSSAIGARGSASAARRRRARRCRRHRGARAADARESLGGRDRVERAHLPNPAARRTGSPECGSCPSRARGPAGARGRAPSRAACSAPRSPRRRARARRTRFAHRERPAVAEAGEPHAAHVVALVEHAHRGARDRRATRGREVALRRAGAAEVEREHHEPGLAREAVGELGVGRAHRGRATRTVGEAVAQHEARARARAAAAGRSARRVGGRPTRMVSSMSRLLWTMAPAFKEWAVVVHALLEGEQILDVRKGGLHEEGRHFALQSTRFWLYPTAEHQKAELLKEPYRHWIDLASASPVGEPIRDRRLGRRRPRRHHHRARAARRHRVEADLDARLRRVTARLEEARPAVGARAARAPAAEPVTVPVARRVRRLHVVGRPRRPARRSRVAAVRARALRRRVRAPARRARSRPLARRSLAPRTGR